VLRSSSVFILVPRGGSVIENWSSPDNLQECIVRGHAKAAQTVQLGKELTLMSFPAPPSPDEEGQVVNKRPPPAPYENDIHMDDVNDIDAIPQSPPTP